VFVDRKDAGRQLADALRGYKDQPVVVFGLPRGGVVVAGEVASVLNAPLDLIVVRKIGHPLSPEYAIGAVSADGDVLTNPQETATVDQNWLAQELEHQVEEACRRRDLFLHGRETTDVSGKVAIVIDDGIATGFTVEAAVRMLRKRDPARIVLAAPVAAQDTADRLRPLVDKLVLLAIPDGMFGAIGAFYADFEQVSDDEVMAVIEASNAK